MKLRINLMLFSAVLALALGAHAQAATLSSSATLPFCVADLAAPELPNFSPSPILQASIILPKCGPCSSFCSGLRVGSVCGTGGGGIRKTCSIDVTCTDGTPKCICDIGN